MSSSGPRRAGVKKWLSIKHAEDLLCVRGKRVTLRGSTAIPQSRHINLIKHIIYYVFWYGQTEKGENIVYIGPPECDIIIMYNKAARRRSFILKLVLYGYLRSNPADGGYPIFQFTKTPISVNNFKRRTRGLQYTNLGLHVHHHGKCRVHFTRVLNIVFYLSSFHKVKLFLAYLRQLYLKIQNYCYS